MLTQVQWTRIFWILRTQYRWQVQNEKAQSYIWWIFAKTYYNFPGNLKLEDMMLNTEYLGNAWDKK